MVTDKDTREDTREDLIRLRNTLKQCVDRYKKITGPGDAHDYLARQIKPVITELNTDIGRYTD